MSSSNAESSFFDQVRWATSNSNMPLASLTSVANSPVKRRRISSFGSSTLRVFSKCLGSWFRSQRIFGAVKPVRAGLATSLIRFARPPTRRSISSHSAAVRWSFQRIARRMTLLFLSRNTEPCIWPDRPIAFTSAGLSFALAIVLRTDRIVACHQSSGSCSLQSGLGNSTDKSPGPTPEWRRARRWPGFSCPTCRCRCRDTCSWR